MTPDEQTFRTSLAEAGVNTLPGSPGAPPGSMEQVLNPRHTHSGGARDGTRIPDKYIREIYKFQFINAVDFETTNANVAIANVNGFTSVVFTDGVSAIARCDIVVPAHKRGFGRISILFFNQNANSDIRLSFDTNLARINQTPVNDGTAFAQFDTGGATGDVNVIDVPRAAYDDLGLIGVNNVFSLEINRDGANVLDTYNNDLEIIGLLLQFG